MGVSRFRWRVEGKGRLQTTVWGNGGFLMYPFSCVWGHACLVLELQPHRPFFDADKYFRLPWESNRNTSMHIHTQEHPGTFHG